MVLLSFLLTVWIPLCGASRHGDISNWYTDHLHHDFAVWVFLERGFDVYRMSFGEVAKGVSHPHQFVSWAENPMVYPPGVFLVFAPPAVLASVLHLSLQQLGVLTIVWLLGLAHLSLLAFGSSLAEARGGQRVFFGMMLWLMLLRMALNGFYDVVWLGCAAMMVRDAGAGRHGRAFLWCSLAALMHYRAVVLVPLLVWLTLDLAKQHAIDRWPWKTMLVGTLIGLLSLYTFVLMYPHSEAGSRTTSLGRMFVSEAAPWMVVAMGVIFSAIANHLGGWVAAATSAIVSGIGLLELPTYRGAWWHSCIAISLPILATVPLSPRVQDVARLRQLGIALLLILEALVFHDNHGGTFGLLTQIATDYHFR